MKTALQIIAAMVLAAALFARGVATIEQGE
jgi:hypothetical protein